jgi:hypothetical protein
MHRLEDNFAISPQSSIWDGRQQLHEYQPCQPQKFPSQVDYVAEQKDDELSASRSPTSVTLNDWDFPGLESVLDQGKEVVPRINSAPPSLENEKRMCGIRRLCFVLALLAAAFAVITVSVGLGVSLGRRSHRREQISQQMLKVDPPWLTYFCV